MPAVATALTIAAVAAAPTPTPDHPIPGASPLAVPAQTALVRRGRAAIEVRCLAFTAAGCHGRLELRVLVPASALGVARVDLGPAERATIHLKVRRGARRVAAAAGAGAVGSPAVARFRADGTPEAVTAGAVGLR